MSSLNDRSVWDEVEVCFYVSYFIRYKILVGFVSYEIHGFHTHLE